MPFPIAAAVAAALPEAYRFIKGRSQIRKGEEIGANNPRPIYTRPAEAKAALQLAETEYLNGSLPGKETTLNQLGSGFANGIDVATQAASSGQDILDALTKLDYNKSQQLNEIATQEAAYKQGQLGNYQDALYKSAGYTDKEFAYNKDQPFQDRAAEASAMIGAGNANVGTTVNNAASLATTLLMDQTSKSSNPTTPLPTFKPLPADAGKLNFSPGLGSKMVYDPITKTLKKQ